MQINFNTNQPNTNLSFGQLVVTKKAADSLRYQLRDFKDIGRKKEFLNTFSDCVKKLNALPMLVELKSKQDNYSKGLVGILGEKQAALRDKLTVTVNDVMEKDVFDFHGTVTFNQTDLGSLTFLKSATEYAEGLNKDTEELTEVLKSNTTKIVGSEAKTEKSTICFEEN